MSPLPQPSEGVYAQLAAPVPQDAPPGAPAVYPYQASPLGFTALVRQAQSLAGWLHGQGLQPGQVVLIAIAPGTELLVGVYAALLCGARLALVDVHMGPENYRAKLRQLQPAWALADSRLLLLQEHPLARRLAGWLKPGLPALPPHAAARYLATGAWMPLLRRIPRLASLLAEPAGHPFSDARSQAEIITYTSGTLAEPKGVRHTAATIAHTLKAVRACLAPQDLRLATALPQYALLGIEAGLQVFFWPEDLGPQERLRFMAEKAITTLMGPPAEFLPLLGYLEQSGQTFPPGLHIILGAAPVHAAFLTRLQNLMPGNGSSTALYGMTECLPVASASAAEKLAYSGPGDYLGKPVCGARIRIAVDGEIEVQAPWLFDGYLGRPPLPPDAWHPTGDLGFLTPDGALILTGRRKDMIIRRNFNLYPGLYEPTLARLPGVREAVLVGVYNPALYDEEVFLILETARPLPVATLQKAWQTGASAIDREAWPDFVIQARALPRGGRQLKTDRNRLRQTLAHLTEAQRRSAWQGVGIDWNDIHHPQ